VSREDCDYAIDRALATGGLDSAGNIIFPVKGTREEIVDQILERAGNWGHPMTREQAKAKADAAINADAKSASRLISATCIAIMILAFVDFVYTVFK
jgi:hypothetical protein